MCERSAAADYLHQNIPPLQSCCCNYNALRCARPNQRLLQPAVTHTHTHAQTCSDKLLSLLSGLNDIMEKRKWDVWVILLHPGEHPLHFYPSSFLPSFLPAILALFLLLLLLLKTKQNKTTPSLWIEGHTELWLYHHQDKHAQTSRQTSNHGVGPDIIYQRVVRTRCSS